MKTRKRILAALLASVLAVGSLAGCGGDEKKASGGKDGETKQVFNEFTSSVVVGLNPILNTSSPDNTAHGMIQEPLVRHRAIADNKSEFVPGIAEKWSVSEDGMTHTFNIRKDAKWSDGEPLTAKDYLYTLQLMADPKVASANGWLFDGVIENFGEALFDKGKTPQEIGVTAPDDNTLEIKLVHPASYFIELIASLYPVRQDKYEEWGEKYGSSPDTIISSGPFKVDSWSQNTEMVLKKNDNYWNTKEVKLDQVNLKVIQEVATAVQAFINGEINQVATADANWMKMLEEAGNSNKQIVPDGAPEWLTFNAGNEYLKNKKIRQALSIAFDREAFVKDVRDGNAIPIYSAMPDTMNVGDKAYTDIVDGKNYLIKELTEENKDPKALFQEGLAELGKDTDTSKVTLRYASRGTTEFSKKMAEWYKQIWEEKIGITVSIDMMEWNIMWDKIDEGDYDIAVAGWGPYYNEPSAILSLYDPDNGFFDSTKTGWVDEDSKKYKELLTKATTVADEAEKAAIYLEAEEILVKGAIISPEYLLERPTYTSKNVKDYFVSTNGTIDWSQPYFE